jgi:hypothetical protein
MVDVHESKMVWVATYGSGFFKGSISNSTVRAIAYSIYAKAGQAAVQLNGGDSIGPAPLRFLWSGSASNPRLSSNTVAKPTFTAPLISAGEMEFKYTLTVTGPEGDSDSTQVRVVIRNFGQIFGSGNNK